MISVKSVRVDEFLYIVPLSKKMSFIIVIIDQFLGHHKSRPTSVCVKYKSHP